MTDTTTVAAEFERPKDAARGDDAPEVVRYWLTELKAADKTEETWRKRSARIIEQYRDEKDRTDVGERVNILWSNVQTLAPALYSNTPKPDIRRRFRDADPVGKVVSDILERAISFSIDQYDFDGVLEGVALDSLLTGRGVPWVRHEPVIMDGQVVWHKCEWDCVYWRDFRVSPARRWENVRWVARALYLSRDELVEKFGEEVGAAVKLDTDTVERDEGVDAKADDPTKRAHVWEIWDKTSRTVKYLAPGTAEALIGEVPDPLKLTGFFPCPAPLYSVKTNDSMTPVPEYVLYEDQAAELNDVTSRIHHLVDMIRVRGVHDQAFTELANLLKADDGKLIPVSEWMTFAQGGGLKGAFDLLDVSPIVAAVAQLYQHRGQLIQTIYEVTGVSDVVRGASNPNETATAQNIKAKFGGLRLTKRQMAVARMVKDMFRITAEIIAEHYDPETLMLMTGIKLPSQQDKAASQQQLAQAEQMAQQTGQPAPPPPPDVVELLKQPTVEEVMQVMRSDALRSYRVDIETDSTVAHDYAEDQQALTGLIQGVTQLWQSWGQMVMQSGGAVSIEVPKALSMAVVRKAKLGRTVEDALDQIQAPPQAAQGQQGPDPAQVKAEAEAQRDQQKAAMEQQAAQAEMALKQQELQLRAEELRLKERELAMKAELAERQHAMAMERMAAEVAKARQDAAGKAMEMANGMMAGMGEPAVEVVP